MAEVVFGVASTLLAALTTKSFQDIALACDFNDDVEKLQNSVKIITAYLLDAENKQANNHCIAEWLKQLREVFDDVGDILDEIEYEVRQREVVKMYGNTNTKICQYFSCFNNPLAFRIKVVHKVRDIRHKIDEKTREGRNLGIVEQHVNTPILEHNLPRRETSSSLPLRVCGRLEEKEKIIKLLMSQQSQTKNIDVVSIVGIGGLGKTTLAQMVYDDDRVKKHFDMLIWVCVSDDFDVKKLIQRIVHADSNNGVDVNSSLDHMVSLLYQKFHAKRFLLVLDDVWNENYNKWDELKNHLLKASSDRKSKGSKIIVTTRSKDVASIEGSPFLIELEPLLENECWKLFVKCAFQEDKEEEKYPRLKQIGEEIVKKCKGVPLAIATLGCLLRSKSHDENEWSKIRDSEVWKLDQENAGILPSLKLSYDHLPPKVKQCFSYFSCFPKDYPFMVNELIMFWMAHGLLQPTREDEDAEDIGESYIEKLISSSLLQIEDHPYEFLGFKNLMTFKTLRMHDLVYDLAKLTMKESSKTRSIVQEGQQGASMEWASNKFNYLKVLHLQDMELTSLPNDCFSKMKKHFRYLNLGYCLGLIKLPNSICKLHNLQSLYLRGCDSLHELPKNMKNLINLQYLFLTVKATSLSSMKIGHLQQLKFLYLFNCSELVSLPSAIGRLTTLKKLLIHGCDELVNFEDQEEEEGKHQHVAVHHSNLQLFDIIGSKKLQVLPTWLEGATKLQYLRIRNIGIKSFPTTLLMASLKELHIIGCQELSSVPSNVYQHHTLQCLQIYGCPKLQD